jgi:hydroxymethylpyrimidine pyrophosphatase-like HAD family hydrolase
MIAIDMDGTLLGDEGRVSSRNLAALSSALSAGIEVVVATGRRHSYAMHVLRPLGLRASSVLISSNGAVTRTLGLVGDASVSSQLIARHHLPNATALWLCNHIKEFRNALVLTFDRVGPEGEDTRGALVVEHLDELNSSIGRWMAANEPYIAQVVPIERALSDADPNHAPIQAMLCGTIERMARAEARTARASRRLCLRSSFRALRPHHERHGGGACCPSSYHPIKLRNSTRDQTIPHAQPHRIPRRDLSILDILPAGCSKGAAVLSLAAARGVDPTQILAIGDNWNDVSMLEIAGFSVLMENAPEDLKDMARNRGWHIAPSNRDDGVSAFGSLS